MDIHPIRTNGETETLQDCKGAAQTYPRLLTRLSHDLPNSPLGVNLRLPFAPTTPGVQAWPDVVRQKVRDDYPFLACLELGVRHLRFPASDLEDDVQRERLKLARDMGTELTAVWLWQECFDLKEKIEPYRDQIDAMEVQVAGTLRPDESCLNAIAECRRQTGIPITLAPLMAQEQTPGHFLPRTRIGYRSSELSTCNATLAQAGLRMDRVLCHVDATEPTWETILEFIELLPLSQIEGIDLVVPLAGVDEEAQLRRAVEALLAVATGTECRLFFDPLVDVDRASDINYGLLDRLSNPRPVFHALRCLNTILFADEQTYQITGDTPSGIVELQSTTKRIWLLSSDRGGSGEIESLGKISLHGELTVYDLAAGTSCRLNPDEETRAVDRLREMRKPALVVG